MSFSDMTRMALPASLTAKTSTINVFEGAQPPNPGHPRPIGGGVLRGYEVTLKLFEVKWSSRGRLVTLHVIALRPILAQFKSKSDSHISLVRDEIYSNPCLGPL